MHLLGPVILRVTYLESKGLNLQWLFAQFNWPVRFTSPSDNDLRKFLRVQY